MDVKAMVLAWYSLLADFLRFFNNEELNKVADYIDSKIAE